MVVQEVVILSLPNSEAIQGYDTAQFLAYPTQQTGVVIAQQFDQDILGDLTDAFNIFIESGQVWALLIGVVIGYLLRSLTAY